MNYSFSETICLYTTDEVIIREVASFCEKYSFKLFVASEETDLVAIPYFLAIVDGSKINTILIDYLEEFSDCDRINECIISHSELSASIPQGLKRFIKVEPEINFTFLQRLVSKIQVLN